jgi:uncharacterized protein (DUF58 family)
LKLRSYSGAALLALALVFLISGLALVRWELISLLIPLVLFLLLAYLLDRPPIIDLLFERRLDSERLTEDDTLQVELHILNRGEPLDYVEAEDEVPPGAAVLEGRSRFPLRLDRGEEVVISYKVKLPGRGYHHFGGLKVRWADPTMMMSKEANFPFDSRVQVVPHLHDLKKCRIQPSRVRVHVGNITSRSLGAGTQFYCLRDYLPGDEIRRLNWKASARLDRPMVNEYETEKSGDVIIVLDGRYDASEEAERDQVVGFEVEAAASLAAHFLKERDRVGMVLLGETIDLVPLGYGKRQFYRVMDKLLEIRPGIMKSPQGINLAMEHYFHLSALVMVISPLQDQRIMSSIEQLVNKGHEVIVLSLDAERLRKKGADGQALELAQRVHRIKRMDQISELNRFCRVIEWDTEEQLSRYFMEGRSSSYRQMR